MAARRERHKVTTRPASVELRGVGSIAAEGLNDAGVRLFTTIATEVLHGHRKQFDTLSNYEQELMIRWLSDALVEGNAENVIHDVLWELDFKYKPPMIEEFIHDDYYLGRAASNLHPKWKEDLYQVFAPGSPYFEWILCLSGDTLVPTLDGALVTLKDLHRRFKADGEPVWVYSIDQSTGEVVPGEATKVVKFGKDRLFKVTLDDGTTVRANADHEFVMRDGTKQKLRDLVVGDRLMPFNTRNQQQKGQRLHAGYEQVYHPGPQKYGYTHRLVGRHIAGGVLPKSVNGDRAVLHHIDFDCKNNHPDNLEWMGWSGHRELHRKARKGCAVSEAQRKRQSAVAKDPTSPLRRGHAKFMATEAGRELARSNLRKARVTLGERRRRLVKATATRWADPGQRRAAAVRCTERSLGNNWGSLSSRVRRDVTVDEIYAVYGDCESLTDTYAILGISRNAVVRVLRDAGLEIADVKSGYRNHRVVSIEADGFEHVYCLTVPAWGNFAIVTDRENRRGIFSGNTGAIGTGKTTVADVAMAYKLAYFSCLRDPFKYYDLMAGSQIVFGVYSITKLQVVESGYYKLRGFIDSSPYFHARFTRNAKIDSKLIFPGSPAVVIPGSRELHALGLDLFAFMMDEANFMYVKDDKLAGVVTGQAYALYNAAYSRMLSRFVESEEEGEEEGTLPGLMLLMSSRNAQTSFLEEHMKADDFDPNHTFVSDYALWEVKATKIKSWFRVEIGDRASRSRILKEGVAQRPGSRIVAVPTHLKRPFLKDVDQGLREVAGIATFNISPLIYDRQSIFDAVRPGLEHPFDRTSLVVDVQDDFRIEEAFHVDRVAHIVDGTWVPKINPGAARFIHVDIGLTGDCLGLSMGHVAGVVRSVITLTDGTVSEMPVPFIVIDLILQIFPPEGSEIDLSKIRSFIIYLSRIYPLARTTFDRFQSSDSIQLLNSLGHEAGHQSVDKTDEAYIMLRSAHFDRRIAIPDYAPYITEILDVQRIVKKRKVDHPVKASDGSKGSKDASDAVAGVVWLCMKDKRARESAAELFGVIDSPTDVPGRARPPKQRKKADMTRPRQAVLPGAVESWDELGKNLTS